jgi:hypothetical protein
MNAIRRFVVPSLPSELMYLGSGTQLAFHGINKSGSLAMANVIKESCDYFGLTSNLLSHYHLGGSVENFMTDVNSRLCCNNLLISHYLYGALLPRPNRVWITQLRHPLPRILSCYQWLKNKSERINGVGSYDSLDVFIEKTKGVAHSQVSQFAFNWGSRRRMLSKSLDASDMLALTMDALERDFSILGIAEYFEESIFIFASLCGLPSVAPWVRDVRNPGRLNSNEISTASTELISEVFKMDFLLYDWALARFQSQLKLFDFGSELDEYKIACSDQYNDRILK